jgi:hypothetical protein
LASRCSEPAGTKHQIEHTRGQARIGEAAHELDAGAGGFLGRLENERAAGRERAADLARGREYGEIPRRKRSHDADRLVHYKLANALAAAWHDTAVRAAAFLGIPFDDLGRRHDLGARLDVDFALLLHHDFRDGVMAFAHQLSACA